MTGIRHTLRRAAGALALIALALPAAAATYPDKPIRLIVPFTTGGVLDTLARTIGHELGPILGQAIVVENRTGASGNIGTVAYARAPADGYTIGMGTIATHGINPSLYGERLPYDPLKDFTPLAMVATQRNVVLVNPLLPIHNVQQLIAHAKANPGRVSYGSAGNGSSQHMAGQMLMQQTGITITHVPYRGSGPALIDLISGNIDLMFVDMPAAMPHIQAGKVRAIGVTSLSRSSALPDVPTVAEQGVPGFEVTAWFGVLAPAHTPQAIVDRLSSEILQIMAKPHVIDKMRSLGTDPVAVPAAAFGRHIQAEITRWAAVVRDLNVKVD